MPDNLLQYCDLSNKTSRTVTYTWSNLSCTVHGTATGGTAADNFVQTNITNTHFAVDHTYQLYYSASIVQFRVWFYSSDQSFADQYIISSINTRVNRQFTIPSATKNMIWSLRVPSGSTANETVSPEIYDITYTDVDADIQAMNDYLGYYNSWFYENAWKHFAEPPYWDGESCSEIACSISYLGGNISKIYVSNYAQGLADLFRANGRFYTPAQGAQRGDFIWFDYDHDGVPDHSGRVMSIDPDGTIHTFEGNVYSVTATFQYNPNDPTIFGFGRPNYDYDPENPPGPAPPKFTYTPYYRHMRRLRGSMI